MQHSMRRMPVPIDPIGGKDDEWTTERSVGAGHIQGNLERVT